MRRSFALIACALIAACSPAAEQAVQAQPQSSAARPFAPTRFSVEVVGEGPDVVLIPGLTASREVWRQAVRDVPGYRYHLVQVAGFAGDPARGNAQGAVVEPLAAEIATYIHRAGLDRPAIVGHSMGGTVAMMIGANAPSRVGKIMVVDMLPQPSGLLGGSAEGMRGLADGLRDLAATPGGRRLFESLIGGFGPPPGPGGGRSDGDVVARAMHELATTDLTADLPRIRAPMTVIYAAPDARARARVDRDYSLAYAGKAGARLVRVDDSGHMVMQDQPARFAAELRRFLAD